jgi:hypothetical protein
MEKFKLSGAERDEPREEQSPASFDIKGIVYKEFILAGQTSNSAY